MANKNFSVGRVEFSENRCVVIAEAGVNHLGDLSLAQELISGAKNAGADVIKFQTYKADKLTTKEAARFWNWEGEVVEQGSQYDSYSLLDSFGIREYRSMFEMCEAAGIEFMSTPFDTDSVDMLVEVGVKGFKIASADITNHRLLRHVASKHLPVLLSTGGSNLAEILEAVAVLEKEGLEDILIMHCTLTYPTPDEDANLSAILDIQKALPQFLVGLSDHSLGVEVGAASVLLGVSALEKHFTVDKNLPLSADHWLSLDGDDLTSLVHSIRRLEKARGHGKKEVLESELLARTNARRSLVYADDLASGSVLTEASIVEKRPGTGISPTRLFDFVGKTLAVSVARDQLVREEDAQR